MKKRGFFGIIKGVRMEIKINPAALQTIEMIVNKGSSAIVRKKGNDIIIQEETRKTKYNPACNSTGGRA